MTGRLRAIVSKLRMTSPPMSLAASPLRPVAVPPAFAAFPLLSALPLLAILPLLAAGCAETAQDASTDSPQVPPAQAPAVPEVTEAPEMSAEPEVPAAAVDQPASPDLREEPDLPEPSAALSHEPVYLTSETTASMNLPFSDAVRMGHLLFLSGQIGNIPGTTDLASGGIQGEARQTMENIRTVLEANGSSMDRVIKATVMLADISEWPAFNEVYVTYFPGDKPARSAFAGSGLAFGARCEVEVIAVVGE